MKKMMTVCFVFMFLLAVVAGCPGQPGETKPDVGNSSVIEFDTVDDVIDTMTTTDDVFTDIVFSTVPAVTAGTDVAATVDTDAAATVDADAVTTVDTDTVEDNE